MVRCEVFACPPRRDHRNLGLVGTTDGVPLFDNKHRGLWPFFFRVANLPDSLATHMANVHLSFLSANEHYELNEATNTLQRTLRGPKSLKPHLTIIVDDLYQAYHKGVFVTDSTVPRGMSGRHFRCKNILLLWTGDQPAQALVSGMHSKCCHWCHFEGVKRPEVSRMCWRDHRKCLGTICLQFGFLYTYVYIHMVFCLHMYTYT